MAAIAPKLTLMLVLAAGGCASHSHGLAPPRAGNSVTPPTLAPAPAPSPTPAAPPSDPACQPLQTQLRATYTFKPSHLNKAEQDSKAALMDQVWSRVQADPLHLAPCLRAALADPAADPFFLFDGSALLVTIDPGLESKALQVRLWTAAPLEDLDLGLWVETLARRGSEGFDVSAAGVRWLEDPARSYRLGDDSATIDAHLGALFLFGSMDEAQATPALVRLATTAAHPGRLNAIWMLVFQMTSDAVRALRTLDVSAMPDDARAAIQALLADVPPRRPAGNATAEEHAQAVTALQALNTGDAQPFETLRTTATRGQSLAAHLAGVLRSDDVALLRQARRTLARTATPAAADDYIALSTVIGVLVRPR